MMIKRRWVYLSKRIRYINEGFTNSIGDKMNSYKFEVFRRRYILYVIPLIGERKWRYEFTSFDKKYGIEIIKYHCIIK